MRLIKIEADGPLGLTDDLVADIPPYAILSHVWLRNYAEEVSWRDMRDGTAVGKAGYRKIEFCARQAQKDGLSYCWVDTCCINKESSAELSEAINSMFRWYACAHKCYVYLADVSTRKRNYETGSEPSWHTTFLQSRWFKRGWTLQELLAQKAVEFYSAEETALGDKNSLVDLIANITCIPTSALHGQPLTNFPVMMRKSWVNGRQTTRTEDLAYCLLGILNVSLPIFYGEGDRAWGRLKEALIRSFGEDLGSFSSSEGYSQAHRTQIDRIDGISEVLESLRFEQMSAREATISETHASTCQWLLHHPTYRAWHDPHELGHHRGFLWVSGKPGAGKSTLIKYAYSIARRENADQSTILAFFFNARGNDLTKATVGMYRSLLYQLLNEAKHLQDVLAPAGESLERSGKRPVWTVKVLTELLSKAIFRRGLGLIECFIDALDECEEAEVRLMVKYFEGLVGATDDKARIRVCFARRHYPTITIKTGCRMVLEHEEGHIADLKQYVEGHFEPEPSPFVNEIKTQVLTKANGLFMWVVLVVEMLNAVFREGRLFAVHKRLQEIPEELSDVFRGMLTRDSEHRDEFLLCIQRLLFSLRPLSLQEYYYALVAGLDPSTTSWGMEVVPSKYVSRYVRESSKGLAEITKSSPPTVQFIHESVRDFFLKEKGFGAIWFGKIADFPSASHDRLKTCCSDYLNTNARFLISSLDEAYGNDEVWKTWSVTPQMWKTWSIKREAWLANMSSKLPFARYACQYMLKHTNQAAKGRKQNGFISHLPTRMWGSALEAYWLEDYDHPHRRPGNLLSVASKSTCSHLVKQWCDLRPQDVNRPDLCDRTPLSHAVGAGHAAVPIIIKSLLSYGATVDMQDDKGDPLIITAVARGDYAVVQLLLSHGADVEASDLNGQTPLMYAAQRDLEPIAHLLLDHGAKVDVADNDGRTALLWASDCRSYRMLKLLLCRGANVNATDNEGSTPLLLVASSVKAYGCRLLLQHGANIHAKNALGMTAKNMATLAGSHLPWRALKQAEGTRDVHPIPSPSTTDREEYEQPDGS